MMSLVSFVVCVAFDIMPQLQLWFNRHEPCAKDKSNIYNYPPFSPPLRPPLHPPSTLPQPVHYYGCVCCVCLFGCPFVTIFRPLTSYNKRESCASSATTTTLLGPPPGNNYLSQRGSNGALHLYSMPRAISPLMQVNSIVFVI